MRAVLDQLDAVERRQLLAALGIVLVNVPGVPAARLVDRIDPELVAGTRQRFAAARLVEDALERAVGGNRHLQNGVLEQAGAAAEARCGGDRARDHRNAERRHGADAGHDVAVCHGERELAHRQRRVDDQQRLALALGQLPGDGLERRGLSGLAGGDRFAQFAFGVLIDLADRGDAQGAFREIVLVPAQNPVSPRLVPVR